MKKFKVYYCYMIDGVWEHTEIVEAENWQEARRAILKKLNLTNVNELDYINEKEVKNMKITAKVVYKDETHRRLEGHLEQKFGSLQRFVDRDDRETAAHVYTKIQGIAWAMYIANCISIDRFRYIENRANKVMGWA